MAPKVAEAAVVVHPQRYKGAGYYAYVTLVAGATADDSLATELRQWTRTQTGPIATPDLLQRAPQVAKHGLQIMAILRRLRK